MCGDETTIVRVSFKNSESQFCIPTFTKTLSFGQLLTHIADHGIPFRNKLSSVPQGVSFFFESPLNLGIKDVRNYTTYDRA